MWFKIYELSTKMILHNNDRMIMDCHERLKFFNTKKNDDYYSYNGIINIIVHYYFHTKNIPLENKLIDIDNNNILLNTNLINKYRNEPIFNAICSLYHRKKNEKSYYIPNIETMSIISKCKIDQNIFTKEKNNSFNIKLFEYQKKAIMRMIEIENNINMDFIRSNEYKMDKDKIIWDPYYDMIVENNAITKIKSSGGILSDTMGLGKTITTIGLMHYGKTIEKKDIVSLKTYSKATLVIVPSHLAKQWMDEYLKAYNMTKKVVVILTKTQHDKTTYQDIIEADIVIVTIQFLLNIKNYCSINYEKIISLSSFNYNKRYDYIIRYHFEMIENNVNYLETTTKPLFECFHFNRVIIDEGHEIMEEINIGGKVNDFIQHFIKNIEASYKWYISGTPFTSFNGLKNIINYLNIEFINDNEIMTVYNDGANNMNNFIINNKRYDGLYNYMSNTTIMERFLQTIMIRHLKDDVKNDVKLLGYEEEIEWVEMTTSEKKIYDSNVKENMNASHRRVLQQICCHPLIAESYKKIIGNEPVSLEEVQEKLVEYHNDIIKLYTEKIAALNKTNQAYKMLLSKYNTIISESKFVLSTLEKINENLNFNEDENCIICYDTMTSPILTPCGHLFCNNCIQMCLKMKPECPMCKNNVTPDKLVEIKKKKSNKVEENSNSLVNPLIIKYGTKLGKLIQMTRTLLSQDARIIIFSQWDDMLSLIGKSMGENGIDCSFISGNVYCKNKAINRFKMGGNNNSVILLSLAKSASGTNLTEATHIIIVEPIDEKKENIKAIEGQAIGRAVRLGQKQVIKVIRILCKDTIEEEIYNSKYIQ